MDNLFELKTKIQIDLLKLGEHTETILKAVARHNEGVVSITPDDLQRYLKVRAAIYMGTTCDTAHWHEDASGLNITSDKGKTYSLSLKWVELHELKDDLPSTLFNGQSEVDKDHELLNMPD